MTIHTEIPCVNKLFKQHVQVVVSDRGQKTACEGPGLMVTHDLQYKGTFFFRLQVI